MLLVRYVTLVGKVAFLRLGYLFCKKEIIYPLLGEINIYKFLSSWHVKICKLIQILAPKRVGKVYRGLCTLEPLYGAVTLELFICVVLGGKYHISWNSYPLNSV